MPRYAALSSLTVAAVAACLFAAGPASASDVPTYCPFQGVQILPDGSNEFAIEALGAGCVVVDARNGNVTLADLVLAPGWTEQMKRDDDRVEVRFSRSATKDRVEVRVEPGKTEVKK